MWPMATLKPGLSGPAVISFMTCSGGPKCCVFAAVSASSLEIVWRARAELCLFLSGPSSESTRDARLLAADSSPDSTPVVDTPWNSSPRRSEISSSVLPRERRTSALLLLLTKRSSLTLVRSSFSSAVSPALRAYHGSRVLLFSTLDLKFPP